MDFTQVLRELWQRKVWVAIGVAVALFAGLSTAYRVSLLPPGLHAKQLAMGTANTQILIDSPRSALTDLGIDTAPLAQRASVFARFMTSEPVRASIASQLGVNKDLIYTEAPLAQNQPKAAQEPTSPQRSNAILGEQDGYRLRFSTDMGLPTVTIDAQAPNAADAVKLANAGAAGFKAYVRAVQNRQGIPLKHRVTIRQLGHAEGGTVAPGVNAKLAVVITLAAFVVWCLLVLLTVSVARSWRELDAAEAHGDDQAQSESAG